MLPLQVLLKSFNKYIEQAVWLPLIYRKKTVFSVTKSTSNSRDKRLARGCQELDEVSSVLSVFPYWMEIAAPCAGEEMDIST